MAAASAMARGASGGHYASHYANLQHQYAQHYASRGARPRDTTARTCTGEGATGSRAWARSKVSISDRPSTRGQAPTSPPPPPGRGSPRAQNIRAPRISSFGRRILFPASIDRSIDSLDRHPLAARPRSPSSPPWDPTRLCILRSHRRLRLFPAHDGVPGGRRALAFVRGVQAFPRRPERAGLRPRRPRRGGSRARGEAPSSRLDASSAQALRRRGVSPGHKERGSEDDHAADERRGSDARERREPPPEVPAVPEAPAGVLGEHDGDPPSRGEGGGSGGGSDDGAAGGPAGADGGSGNADGSGNGSGSEGNGANDGGSGEGGGGGGSSDAARDKTPRIRAKGPKASRDPRRSRGGPARTRARAGAGTAAARAPGTRTGRVPATRTAGAAGAARASRGAAGEAGGATEATAAASGRARWSG